MEFDQRLFLLARKAAREMSLAVFCGLVAGLLTIAQAGCLSRLLVDFIQFHTPLKDVETLLVILGVIFILKAAAGWGLEVISAGVAIKIKTNLREQLFARWLKLGPVIAQCETAGERAVTALQAVEELDAFYRQYVPQILLAGFIPLMIFVAVIPRDWLSALIFLLTAPMVPFFMILIGRTSERVTRKQWSYLGKMSAFFLDTLQGMADLKLLGQSHERLARIAEVSEKYRKTTLQVLRVTFVSAFVLELIGTISTALIAVALGLRLLSGGMGLEQSLFILILAPEFYLPLRQLGQRFHAAISGVAASRRIFSTLEAAEAMEGKLQVVENPQATGRTNYSAEKEFSKDFILRLEQVSFTYPSQEFFAINEIDLSIQRGQRLAIVGANGAGKSTLFQLLLRFVEPQSGQITLNGLPLMNFAPEEWRKQIAWVPQRPALTSGSLSDNLRIANNNASTNDLIRALSQAHLDEWVKTLPKGLETAVGEKGVKLSGGQAQRLALARAFLKPAQILLLDEPTAHLDPLLSGQLDQSIQELSVGRTVITIAHTVHFAASADVVVVLDGGRVIEFGPPEKIQWLALRRQEGLV